MLYLKVHSTVHLDIWLLPLVVVVVNLRESTLREHVIVYLIVSSSHYTLLTLVVTLVQKHVRADRSPFELVKTIQSSGAWNGTHSLAAWPS